MNVKIITRSFVREINYLLRYAQDKGEPINFSVIVPHSTSKEELPSVNVSRRKIYFKNRMRATYYAPSIFFDILKFQPDILHIFEEFSGLIAFQSLLLNRIAGRKSKVLLYSAENLHHNIHTFFVCRWAML